MGSIDRFASQPTGPGSALKADWLAAGYRYHSLNFFLRRKFGCRVWKVSLDAGLSCPNADGTKGSGGCIFCNMASFSPSRRWGLRSIRAQLEEGICRIQKRHAAQRFIAYFQPGTNTYAPMARLAELYRGALEHPAVVGLAVGTRPDCAPDEVLDLLAQLGRDTWVCVEYGLQTIHARTLAWLNRRHDFGAFVDAVTRTHSRGLHVGAHVILGLPGESRSDMLATACQLARLPVDSVKIHNLYAPTGTRLAELVTAGAVRLPELAEYVGHVVAFLEHLPPHCVIDRLSGEPAPGFLVAPAWCANKHAVRQAIHAELARQDTWQGRCFDP